MSKAYFFDRDGTIIVDKDYLSDPAGVEFFPEALRVLKKIQSEGHLCFIVTNQSGVGRGFFPVSKVLEIHKRMDQLLLKQGLKPFDEYVFCPHAPEDGCPCRKPNPTMINDLITRWKLDKENCLMVGDKMSDYEAGINAGINSLFLGKSDSVPSVQNLEMIDF